MTHACSESVEVELLVNAQRGDRDAFDELARAHVDRLFAVAVRIVGDRAEAEDVVQEALLRAWRSIGRFRGRSAVFTWLYRITANEASRSLKIGARRPQTVDLGHEQLRRSSSLDDGPARRAEYREFRAALNVALLALPHPYRAAVILRDIEGLSTREAADAVGIGEAALKSRLHEARRKIRTALGDDGLIATPG
jgi:RNA polymerase sigma-70 factor (ECF subfamily)